MSLMSGVVVCLAVFGAVRLCSVLAGLRLCLVWRASWKFVHVALCTIKRDLM